MEAWGIMNVKNATIYSLSQNEGGSNLLVPTLFLDSLKVSDISQNAGSIIWAAAKEKGLIGWSNPKSIYSLSMEDSLFSIGNLNLTLGREFFKNLINGKESCETNPLKLENIREIDPIIVNHGNVEQLLINNEDIENFIIEDYCNKTKESFKWRIKIDTFTKTLFLIPERIYKRNNGYVEFDFDYYPIYCKITIADSYQYVINYKLKNGDFIRVFFNDNITISKKVNEEWFETNEYSTSVFENIQAQISFNSNNEMLYYIINKYPTIINNFGKIECYTDLNFNPLNVFDVLLNGEKILKHVLIENKNREGLLMPAGELSGFYRVVFNIITKDKNDKETKQQIIFDKCLLKNEFDLTLSTEPSKIKLGLETGEEPIINNY